jgi:hypothetical protein
VARSHYQTVCQCFQKVIIVNVVMRSGSEAPNSWYHMDMWTHMGQDGTNKQRIREWRGEWREEVQFRNVEFRRALLGQAPCLETITEAAGQATMMS